jgi:hypothetical protein
MTKTRIIFAATILLGFMATNASRADGLDRFEKIIKPQIPPDAFTYKSGKALGAAGFELSDVVVTPPPSDPKAAKPEPIAIKTITVENLDFDAIEKQQPPLFAKLRFDGITTGPNPGGAIDLKQLAGLDKLSADFQLDYRLVPETKTLTLSRMELNLTGLARLETSMVLDGVTADTAATPNSAMDDSSLRTGTVVYDDHSLLAKAIPIAAAMQGSDAKALIAMAIAMLDAARVDQGPAAQKAIDTLVAFIEDYQSPKGPLKVAFNPPGKVTSADMSNAKSADEIVKLLGIEVSYAGSRKSTPSETPAAAVGPGDKDVPAKEDNDSDSNTLNKKKD